MQECMMRTAFILGACTCLILACGSLKEPTPDTGKSNGGSEGIMNAKEFTESDARKALLRDLKFPPDSAIRKALLEERFDSKKMELYIIETSEDQLSFSLREMKFWLVRG